MSELKRELKASLGELMDVAQRESGPHPSVEELAAYDAGELAPEAERRVQEHLVVCRDCLDLLVDCDGLADPSFGSQRAVSETEKALAWEALQARMASERVPERPLPPRRLPLASVRVAYALAASLMVVAVGLSMRIVGLQRALEELSAPQLNAPVGDLFPPTAVRGEAAAATLVELPATARLFAVILYPSSAPDEADFMLEIVTAEGEEVWSGEGLRKDPYGAFTLILSRRLLAAGDYRILLYSAEDTGRKLIQEFRLRLVDR